MSQGTEEQGSGGQESRLRELTERLKQERDELRVKMSLGAAELSDEWDELEEKWEGLRRRLRQAADAADEAGDDIKAAARMLAEEIREGYERVRKRL